MASVALDPAYRRTTIDEFLAMDIGDAKAELEDGLIYMMAGGNEAHARIAGNIIIYLGLRLRGTRCRPYGSDLAMRTGDMTVRFPDVSVYRDLPASPERDQAKLLGDPRVVFEVLSPSTKAHDQKTQLNEYRNCPGVADIIFVDPQTEQVRIVSRTERGGWTDEWLDVGNDIALPSLDLIIPRIEIFARD